MSVILLLINLLSFSFSKQNIACDSVLTISDEYKSLSDCSNFEVEENMNCCVGVISIMGKNQFFCESFDKSATVEDISSKMDEKVESMENKFLGAVVKAKANCTGDVEPFVGTYCNIEDSQNSTEFNNCSAFKKQNDDDYCCLFSGNVLQYNDDKQNVNFCYEVNKKESSNMDNVADNIDSINRMINIKYLNCTPEIPVNPPKGNHFFLNINFFFILLIISLIA